MLTAVHQHFLRSEPGIYYEDLYPLICFLPRYSTLPPAVPHRDDINPLWTASALDDPVYVTEKQGQSSTSLPSTDGGKTQVGMASRQNSTLPPRRKKFNPHQVLPVFASDKPLLPSRDPPSAGFWDYFGFLRPLRPLLRWVRCQRASDLTMGGRKKQQNAPESSVPLEITLVLNTYLASLQKGGVVTPAIASGLVSNIGLMQDTFNNLERIRNTPLPFAYQAHLRISLWCVYFMNGTPSIKCSSPGQVISLAATIPNCHRLQVVDHTRHCVHRLFTSWFLGNWTADVRGQFHCSFEPFLIDFPQ